ncbi:uncharacterized protein LOC144218827 [Crocuta crocuta]
MKGNTTSGSREPWKDHSPRGQGRPRTFSPALELIPVGPGQISGVCQRCDRRDEVPTTGDPSLALKIKEPHEPKNEPLEPEHNSSPTASKEMGTSVLEMHGTKFCQQPAGASDYILLQSLQEGKLSCHLGISLV